MTYPSGTRGEDAYSQWKNYPARHGDWSRGMHLPAPSQQTLLPQASAQCTDVFENLVNITDETRWALLLHEDGTTTHRLEFNAICVLPSHTRN